MKRENPLLKYHDFFPEETMGFHFLLRFYPRLPVCSSVWYCLGDQAAKFCQTHKERKWEKTVKRWELSRGVGVTDDWLSWMSWIIKTRGLSLQDHTWIHKRTLQSDPLPLWNSWPFHIRSLRVPFHIHWWSQAQIFMTPEDFNLNLGSTSVWGLSWAHRLGPGVSHKS